MCPQTNTVPLHTSSISKEQKSSADRAVPRPGLQALYDRKDELLKAVERVKHHDALLQRYAERTRNLQA